MEGEHLRIHHNYCIEIFDYRILKYENAIILLLPTFIRLQSRVGRQSGAQNHVLHRSRQIGADQQFRKASLDAGERRRGLELFLGRNEHVSQHIQRGEQLPHE